MRRLAVILVAASACTGPSPRPSAPPGSVPPAPAGTVRIGYPAEPPTLNPVAPAGASRATRDVLRAVYPALFALDAKLRPVPELATAVPDTSGPQVRITLRRASWSDGSPITAEDVRFTWERLRSGPTAVRYRLLRDVRVEGPRALTLVFDRPVRRPWALFSLDDMVLPSRAFGDGTGFDRATPVAGGPFRVEAWTPGLEIRLRRNDAYWGDRARVEAIAVVFVPTDETRLMLLERGELELGFFEGDATLGARAAARGWKETDGSLEGRPASSGAWGPAWWELAVDLERLRDRPGAALALGQSLDRSLFAEMLEDTGQVMNGIPARFPADAPRREGVPALPGPWGAADATAARRNLSASGAKDEIVLVYPSGSLTAAAMARVVHYRMRDLGVHVEIVGVEPSRLETEWIPRGLADAYLVLRRGADAPDAQAYRSDASPLLNPSRARGADAAIDDAVTASASRPDTGLASGAWTRVQQSMASSGAVWPLVRVRTWIVSRGGIAGPRARGDLSGPLWNAAGWSVAG